MVQANSGGSSNMRTAPVGSAMRKMYDDAMRGNDDAFYEDIPEGAQKMREDPTRIAVSTEVSKLRDWVVCITKCDSTM